VKGSILLAKIPSFPKFVHSLTDKQMLPFAHLSFSPKDRSVLVCGPICGPSKRVEAGPTDLTRPDRLPESLSP
jgi:hypothetical protein